MRNFKFLSIGRLMITIVLMGMLSNNAIAFTYLYGHWTDVNKYWGVGQPPGTVHDGNACWLAAAANVLNYTDWNASGHKDAINIYDDFLVNVYTGSSGYGYRAYDAYFNQYYPTQNSNNYLHQHYDESTMLQTIDNYLQSGYGVYLAVYDEAHAITCWGYDRNDITNEYTHIYITDSDDHVTALQRIPVNFNHINDRWDLGGSYSGWYIERIDAFEAETPRNIANTVPLDTPYSSTLFDQYGRAETFIFEGEDQLYDWAGYVRYERGGTSETSWLYDLPYFEWIDPDVSDGRVRSRIWNEDLSVEITTFLKSWSNSSIRIEQRYTFRNINPQYPTLTNFKFYQYLDADINGELINRANVYRHYHEIEIKRGSTWIELEDVSYPSDLWWDSIPGYNIPGGYDVGNYEDIISRIESDSLLRRSRAGSDDVAGAIRWSTWDGTTPIDLRYNGPAYYLTVRLRAAVPEPSTMLLLGTGLAGLAGRRIVMRRKRVMR
jgi:hypothetical protein